MYVCMYVRMHIYIYTQNQNHSGQYPIFRQIHTIVPFIYIHIYIYENLQVDRCLLWLMRLAGGIWKPWGDAWDTDHIPVYGPKNSRPRFTWFNPRVQQGLCEISVPKQG